jgi:hypothetical protein
LHDRAAKFSGPFDEVSGTKEVRVIRTRIRAPKASAFAEWNVKTVRSGCLDHVLVYERRHLDRVLRASVTITRNSGRIGSWTWLPEPACTRLRQGVREGRRLRERTCSGV